MMGLGLEPGLTCYKGLLAEVISRAGYTEQWCLHSCVHVGDDRGNDFAVFAMGVQI